MSKTNKKQKIQKIPKISNKKTVDIFGILDNKKLKLVKVDLKEKDIWFHYDIHYYDEKRFSVVKLTISIK